jgi:hypothetical protein
MLSGSGIFKEKHMNEVIDAAPERAVVGIDQQPTPAYLLQLAVQKGTDLDQLERLMALQERWEATEARKAYDAAFSAFKAEAVVIVKNKSVSAGPLSGKKYAELFSVVNAVTPALSRNGLSSSWQITKDQPDWIEVTCKLMHIAGHIETVSMGGPPDIGGAKNPIQARASTISYLQRYTLKAITGLSEQDDDTDGGQGAATDGQEHPKLQAGRDAAMDGMASLTAWWGKLSAQDRKALNSEFPRLRTAAQQAGA